MNSMSVFEDRRQVLGLVHLISGLTLILFVFLHWLEGCCIMLQLVETVLAAIMIFTYWSIRKGADLGRVENILMTSALVLFSALVFFESIESSGIYWLAGFPFITYFITQVQKARYWVSVFVFGLFTCISLQALSLIETPYSETQLFQITIVVIFFWVFAHIYQSQLEWRKQQLEESYRVLAQQQNRMQVILDHSPIGIWMVDQQSHIQFINQAWMDMCGISESQVQSTELLPDVLTKTFDAKDLDQVGLNQTDTDQAYYQRHEMMCADGQSRTFDFIKVHLAHQQGEEAGIVAFAIDVTEKLAAEEEQKSLEKQVQHSQRLESLGIMAGGIAHDFNNLLTVIQGSVELAKLEDNLTESMQESLTCMDSAAHAATDLCRQMLDYSGKGVMQSEPVNLHDLIENMLPLLYASKGKNVELSFHIDKQQAWVLADRGQLRQVLLNLVINASEAISTEQGGDIHVSIVQQRLDEHDVKRFSDIDLKPGKYAGLVVKDNGMGMDAATIEHIFDPFFTTKFTGRGLGMSAILGILRSHDAGMEIDSTPGVGTTMSVWFPAIDAATHAHLANHTEVKRAMSGRVLLVDDEPGVLHVTSRMLARLGLTVATAANGREAAALFEKDSDFDWVLLDVTMPDMGGVACLERLRATRPDIYVTMSSGFDAESALSPENHYQPNDFLTKPFTLDKLRAVAAKASE